MNDVEQLQGLFLGFAMLAATPFIIGIVGANRKDHPRKVTVFILGVVGIVIGGIADGWRSALVAMTVAAVVIAYVYWVYGEPPIKDTEDEEPEQPPMLRPQAPKALPDPKKPAPSVDLSEDEEHPLCVPGAGWALRNPPADEQAIAQSLAEIRARTPDAKFVLPLGWTLDDDDKPSLMYTQLGVGADSILITGLKNSGKDNAALWQVLTLMAQHPPEELQLMVVDTKGVDWGIFADKAHTKGLFVGQTEVRDAMRAITKEREMRKDYLQQFSDQGIRKWSKLPPNKPPHLIIVITEITLIIQEVGDKEAMGWLNAELVAWRAFGGFFIVLTQVVNNMATTWRGQIDIFLGAAQNRGIYDEPNVMFDTKEIIKMGAVPPSMLPPVPINAGCFAVSSPSQRSVDNVRSSFIEDPALVRILAGYPNKRRELDTSQPPIDLWQSRVAALSDERNKARSMSDDEIIDYILDRLDNEDPNDRLSRRKVANALWGHNGGSGPTSPNERLTPLWERAMSQRRKAVQ
jgi:hypothetical protein